MQMTKLAHRVSALEDQQFLIIHATADGEDRVPHPLPCAEDHLVVL